MLPSKSSQETSSESNFLNFSSQSDISDFESECERKRSKDRARKQTEREAESPSQREHRLEHQKEYKRNIKKLRSLSDLSDDQQDVLSKLQDLSLSKQKDAEAHARARENESEDHRLKRLKKDRETHAKALELMKASSEEDKQYQIKQIKLQEAYYKTINQTCEHECLICVQMHYRDRVVNHTLSTAEKKLLKDEYQLQLSKMKQIFICKHCCSLLRKNKVPPTAFWNNWDPGEIPECIKKLSKAEVRMISRIKAYMQIVKIEAKYGQHNFKGQTILFERDIDEVVQPLKILPRATSDLGLVLVTESRENAKYISHFKIDPQHVRDGLAFFKQYNPLYNDIDVDQNFKVDINDLIRLMDSSNKDEEDIEEEEFEDLPENYSIINDVSKILHASICLTSETFFTPSSAETLKYYCFATSLSLVIKSTITSLSDWRKDIMDGALIAGHKLHENICGEKTKQYLKPDNFETSKTNLEIFKKRFSIVFDKLQVKNKPVLGSSLLNVLKEISSNYDEFYSILVVNNEKSFAVIYQEDCFFFVDCHSCGLKGAPTRMNKERKMNVDGEACVIQCDNLEEMARVAIRANLTKDNFELFRVVITEKKSTKKKIKTEKKNSEETKPTHWPIPVPSKCDTDFKVLQTGKQAVSNDSPLTIGYRDLSPTQRILHATHNQGHAKYGSTRGTQCFANSIASIAHAHILPPAEWSQQIVDQNLQEGDKLYKFLIQETIKRRSREHQRYFMEVDLTTTFLGSAEFQSCFIDGNFRIFDTDYEFRILETKNDEILYGKVGELLIQDGVTIGKTLEDSLNLVMSSPSLTPYCVLISNNYTYALFKIRGKYYFTDSHSCGNDGERRGNGTACIIECSTIEELLEIATRACFTGSHYMLCEIELRVVGSTSDNTLDETVEITVSENHYKQLSDNLTHILRASFHQGNANIFVNNNSRGIQCAAMSLAMIAQANILTPNLWTKSTVNETLKEGDKLYHQIVRLNRERNIDLPRSGYLGATNFKPLFEQGFEAFGVTFMMNATFSKEPNNPRTIFWGSTFFDERPPGEIRRSIGLKDSLYCLFHDSVRYGILLTTPFSFGVFFVNDNYYLTDSHGCASTGELTISSGKACILQTRSFDKFCEFIQNRYTDGHMFELFGVKLDPLIMNYSGTDYSKLHEAAGILRASFAQDNSAFQRHSKDRQSFAMSLAMIANARLESPKLWNKSTIDDILIQGNSLHQYIVKQISKRGSKCNNDYFLDSKNLQPLSKSGFKLFNQNFSFSMVSYDSETRLEGFTLHNDDANGGKRLIYSLDKLLFRPKFSPYGILISENEAFAVFSESNKFYFTNSFSCDENGRRSSTNGQAYLAECWSVEQLEKVIIIALGNRNVPYKLQEIILGDAQFSELDDDYSEDYDEDYDENHSVQLGDKPSSDHSKEFEPIIQLDDKSSSGHTKKFEPIVQLKDEPISGFSMEFEPVVQLEEKLKSELSNKHESNNTVDSEFPCTLISEYEYAPPTVDEKFKIEIGDKNKLSVRRKSGKIVNPEHEKRAEEFAWPHLFPLGRNGLSEDRKYPVTPLQYFQNRLMGKDKRFHSKEYLYYALSAVEKARVVGTINTCVKKIKGNFAKRKEDIHLYLRNIRGTAAYWRTARSAVLAQIRTLGPPTYFLTFSCNDLHWPDMARDLLLAAGTPEIDPNSLKHHEKLRLVDAHPMIVSRHFNRRVNAIMTYIRNNDRVLGGKVVDWWQRIEFQQRGSPHLHVIVWVKDHPSLETEEGIEMIDKICSCSIPNKEDDPELHDLVLGVQQHKCKRASCGKERSKKRKSHNKKQRCRFYFPRNPCEETHLVEPNSKEFRKCGGRCIMLKRTYEERKTNNYNPELLKLWQGNMDIQPCSATEVIAFYIAKYISKNEPTGIEKEIKEMLEHLQSDETPIGRTIFKACMKIFQQRNVSACEAAYRLLHLLLYSSSRSCVYLNTRKPELRYRTLKEHAKENFELKNDDKDEKLFSDTIIEKYQKRPSGKEESHNINWDTMSLIEFAIRFEPSYETYRQDEKTDVDNAYDSDESQLSDLEDKQSDNEETPQRKTKKIKPSFVLSDKSKILLRNVPAVVRIPYFNRENDPDGYFYSLLLQYQPFREESDLIGKHLNSEVAFYAKQKEIEETNEYMKKFRERDRALEEAFEKILEHEVLHEEDYLFEIEDEIEGEEIDAGYQPLDEQEFEHLRLHLNGDQTKLYQYIEEILTQEKSQEDIQENIQNNIQQKLRLFITGGAGTGKTHVLTMIRALFNRIFGEGATKVGAVTGMAAKLVQGATLHHIFFLKPQKDGIWEPEVPQLEGERLERMLSEWKNVHCLIIDEISMVSYRMLSHINTRLRQLKDKNKLFGGIHVLVFGDLMQLPPVSVHNSCTSVFKRPVNDKNIVHLWREFSIYELKQNMRQEKDQEFVQILDALRYGKLTAKQFLRLTDNMLTDEDKNGDFAIDKVVHIFPTNKLADQHNTLVLEQVKKTRKIKTVVLTATDKLLQYYRPVTKEKLATIIPTDPNKTGGFVKTLELFEGATVMLRSNLNVSDGLVNGAIGTVNTIEFSLFAKEQLHPDQLPTVIVDFPGIGLRRIPPKEVRFPAGFYGQASRRMLPLILAWGCTAHKLQGTTVDKAVVYLGSKVFAKGQAYVTLSRVRSLEGLRIAEISLLKLVGSTPANDQAIREMERMRNCKSILNN